MGNSGKRLSIIIPVYKVQEYVGQCLQSILDNGADENLFEVVVVNDGTPDDSMSVVRKVCEGHRNVIIVEQENQGLSAARTAGLARAQGKYVWFVDSDDWLEKGAVQTMLEKMDARPGYAVYAMPLLWISSEDSHLDCSLDEDTPYFGRELLRTPYPLWAIQRFIIQRDILDHQSIFFPRGLLHEDEYYYRTLLYFAPKVLLMKDSLYYYRQRSDSIMGAKSARSLYDTVAIFRLLKDFLQKQVEKKDITWFQQDIVSMLLRSYKDSFTTKNSDGAAFRKKHKRLVFSESLACKGFTLKEKLWVMRLLIR